MFNYQNRRILKLVAIGIIAVVVIVVCGRILGYQYFSVQKNNTQSSTTVLSPNGGEIFKPGQHVNIAWNVDSNYPTVQVMVVAGKAANGQYTNNGSMASIRGYNIYTGANTGSLDWTVPTEYPGVGNYFIRIEPQTSGGQASGQVDYSDNYFSVVGSVPDQSANWKTYTNNTYNYQINYIPAATIKEEQGGGLKINYQNGDIEICSTSFGACGNFPGVGPEAQPIARQVTISGKDYSISGFILNGNEELGLNLPNGMFVYLNISGRQNSDTENKLLQILSTFKFKN